MVGFPPHGTISSPTASTSVSHFEERETFGSSPADKKKNMSGLCLAALGILANGLAVEGGHSAAGFPCKVGPGTLQRNLIWCHISNCLRWGLTPPVFSATQLFCFPSVKVTVSITCKSLLDDPFGLGLRSVGASSRAKLAVRYDGLKEGLCQPNAVDTVRQLCCSLPEWWGHNDKFDVL